MIVFSAAQFSAASRPLALAAIVAGCGSLALRHYFALPTLSAASNHRSEDGDGNTSAWPRVSIIVPARNEERNLPTLLNSLTTLNYPNYEIIIVDDASTDATSAIADEFATRHTALVRVIHGSGPAKGWTGKNSACYLGAQRATGEWLLFTDADTQHFPASLRAVIAAAKSSGAQALSLFTQQRCLTFWERLLLPFAYQQYFVGVRPAALRRPGGPALANGQYILIARRAYDAVGGHGAVASSVIDDVALAGVLKREGYTPQVFRGETLVSVRMYDGLGALAEGFTKNAFQFLQQQKLSGALVVLSTACSATVLSSLAAAYLEAKPLPIIATTLAYVAQVATFAPWVRSFGAPLRYAFLAPVAAIVFTLIALSSAIRVLLRRPVKWKGRAYQARMR